MREAVFDASVIVKWFVDDPLTLSAERARGAFAPVAPPLIVFECANAFWKYVRTDRLSVDDATRAIQEVANGVRVVEGVHIVERALALAAQIAHPVYDMTYVATAEQLELPLITADARLIQKIRTLDGVVMTLPLATFD